MITTNDEQTQRILNQVYQSGQGHVLRFWNELSQKSRTKLLNQLNSIDFQLLRELCEKYVFHPDRRLFHGELEPVDIIRLPKTDEQRRKAHEAKQMGEGALRSGKVAALLVAGGQGTRLGFNGPKGMFPIGPVSDKSLFQLLAEKIRAVAKRYDTTIPWYIMTSEANHPQTKEFFQRHHNFGLPEVFFFQQNMVPSVDAEGKLLLEARDRIVTSPNGHGGSLSALKKSGALDDMRRRGIELIFYFQVDNVLLKMCDPVFLGYHLLQGTEMSAKVIQKRDPYEKMGVVGRLDGRLAVIEYSNLSREDMEATNPDGSLKYSFGSIAIHVLNVDFVERENQGGLKLPYHLAHKKIPYLDEQGNLVQPETSNGYKFEMFIFDALGDAREAMFMEVDRKKEFSVVKNAEGEDSPATARQDMTNLYGRWLETAGVRIPQDSEGNVLGLIEISPLFALDEEELKEKIKPDLRFDGKLYLE